MKTLSLYADNNQGISDAQLTEAVRTSLSDCLDKLKKVLIIPPDFTRFHSGAGKLTSLYYHLLKDSCQVDLLPAVGTHNAVSREQASEMFGDIPYDRLIYHDWRRDVVRLGVVPASYIREISDGIMDQNVPVEVNRRLIEGGYDLIISIGQVLPHEVVGMANYSKNIFVGCGGSSMINASHYLGGVYGLERIIGRDHSPVRKVFDYAQEHFLSGLRLEYVLTVTTASQRNNIMHGVFFSGGRQNFENAIALSLKKNLNLVDRPLKKVVTWLAPSEFVSTWVGNKAIYRSRMAIEDGGELIILAPGIREFGEDLQIDDIIRRYGYCGRDKIIELVKTNQDLSENLSAAAHLIHGSSEERFKITYAVKNISCKDIERVCYDSANYDDMIKRYNPAKLAEGKNVLPDGEEIYFISNPAVGLWAVRK